MAKHLTARERVINRERELDQFLEIVETRDRPCLITIEGEMGFGKSSLLELFEAESQRARKHVARWVAEQGAGLMQMANVIADGLGDTYAPCDRFAELSEARDLKRHAAFGFPTPAVVLEVADTQLDRGSSINQNIHTLSLPDWDDGHDRAAERQCLEALLDDLQKHSQRRSVVLLLDQYERAADLVRRWLQKTLHRSLFAGTEPFGALVVVVAYTRTPLRPATALPGPADETAFPGLADELGPRSADLLRPIELQRWREVEFRHWARSLGFSDRMAHAMFMLYEDGWSLKEIWRATRVRLGVAA